MTAISEVGGSAGRRSVGAGRPSHSLFYSARAMLLVGFVLAFLANLQTFLAVWGTGQFFDSDDAMQLVQLRDWLGGQGWFDNLQRRMDPPLGVAMHWTHLVEVPMGLMVRFFGLFAAPATAERMMRIAYPLMCQGGFAASIVLIARRVLPPEGRPAAILLALVSLTSIGQFQPGRITHNAVQVVLLLLMVYGTLGVFKGPHGWRSAVLAGALAAASLAISLENLAFIIAMAAIFGLAWIVRGAEMGSPIAWFGGSFAAAAAVAFAAAVPPTRLAQSACDAFSAAHLIAAAVGGLGYLSLGLFTTRFGSALKRAAAVVAVGGATLLIVAFTYPACLGDPFGAVDPVVRRAWMGAVVEAQPMASYVLHDPIGSLAVVMPTFLGMVASAVAARWTAGAERARWLALLAFSAVGVVTAFWQVRAITYTAALSVFGAAWLFSRCSTASAARQRPAALLLLPFMPFVWAMAAPGEKQPKGEAQKPYADPAACLASSAIAALDGLPPGLIMSTIDPGPFILALTRHSVVTGPYHRDGRGLRLTVDALLGDAATAEAKVKSSKADYFAFCPTARENDSYEAQAPDGFVARLRRGRVPLWLRPVDVASTPYRVYRIER